MLQPPPLMSSTARLVGMFAMGVALATTGCVGEADEGDEAVASDGQEVVTGRCASARASRTVKLKVMTVNLRHDSDDWKRRFPLIADEIVRLDPDVIGLQEIEIADDQADALNDLIAKRGHAKYQIHQKRKSGFQGYFTGEGVGIMSRWKMTEKNHEDLGEMRISVRARLAHPSGGFIDMVNTHLHTGSGEEADANRLDQAKQTVNLADRNDDCWPTFITGDMNAGETSPAMKYIVQQGFVDSFKKVHGAETSKIGKTSSVVLKDGAFEQSPKRRIDFVFGRAAGARTVVPTASGVYFKNHDAKGFYPSDHFGVMTTYDVKL